MLTHGEGHGAAGALYFVSQLQAGRRSADHQHTAILDLARIAVAEGCELGDARG